MLSPIQAIGKKFDFDSGDLGCMPDDRTLESGTYIELVYVALSYSYM